VNRETSVFRKALTICLGILFAAFSTALAQDIKRIRIGYPSVSTTQSHIWVGQEHGLFRRYGLEVEPILLRGGQMATQSLAAGDPPIVNIGTVVQANLQGHSMALVAAVQSQYDFHVFARPGITTLEQLKGKRLGITGFGSATHFASRILLRHLNLEANKDVALVPAGLDPERVAAIASGRIDASFFTSVATPLARKAGLTELLFFGDLGFESAGRRSGDDALLHPEPARNRQVGCEGIRRGDSLYPCEQKRGAESICQIHAQ
jgi:NitT/TauT family transport system substrate-binding protein